MAFKDYFTGHSGKVFWGNIAAAILVLIGTVVGCFIALGEYTNHGEKIEVPDVTGLSPLEAEDRLVEYGLIAVVEDSAYNPKAAPGSVLKQMPSAGQQVKSGRVINLTVNLGGEPMVRFPDLVGNSSLREAEAMLKALGFTLDSVRRVDGEPRDLVVGIRQGMRDLHAGDIISRDRSLVIMAGAGETDSLEIDTTFFMEESAADFDF